MSDVTTAAGLAGFLLARIAEDEAFLRAKWQKRGARLSVHYERGEDPDVNTPLGLSRQLAECEAKRRIMEEHAPREIASLDRETWGQCFDACRTCAMWGRQIVYPCPTLRLLALPYAGHPDFREEWRA